MPKPPTQSQLFDGLKEPPATKASWLLETELRGPGALDPDAYAVYRMVSAAGGALAEAVVIDRFCRVDHNWPARRAMRAITQVVAAGFVARDGAVLRERERERERVRRVAPGEE